MKKLILLLMLLAAPVLACDETCKEEFNQEMWEWRNNVLIYYQQQEEKWRLLRNATPITDPTYPEIKRMHQLTSDILTEWIEAEIDRGWSK